MAVLNLMVVTTILISRTNLLPCVVLRKGLGLYRNFNSWYITKQFWRNIRHFQRMRGPWHNTVKIISRRLYLMLSAIRCNKTRHCLNNQQFRRQQDYKWACLEHTKCLIVLGRNGKTPAANLMSFIVKQKQQQQKLWMVRKPDPKSWNNSTKEKEEVKLHFEHIRHMDHE